MAAHTRRALFGALPMLAGASLVAAPSGVAADWIKAQHVMAELNGYRGGDITDEQHARLWDAEEKVVSGPISSRADAIAKLQFALQTEHMGDRADGLDWDAIRQVVRWLGAH